MNPKNAYYVLELSADATPGEIEREGRKVLGLLEIGSARGASYACPLGTLPRDATMVRDAMACLRDPKRRAVERCLAGLLVEVAPGGVDEDLDAPLRDALAIVYTGL